MDKEYSVMINGESVVFEFKDSLIHTEGEHEGNIDAVITTKPPLPQNLLLDELHIKIPGIDEFLYIYGYGAVENSLKATFNSSVHIDNQNIPEMVEVYWGENGEQFIGEMCCQKYSKEAESNITVEEDEDVEDVEEVETSDVSSSESKSTEKNVSTKDKNIHLRKFIIFAVVMFLIIVAIAFS